MTTIDFGALMSTAKTAGFDALPVGDYDVQCQEGTATKTANGKDMIKAKYKVLSGPKAGTTVFNNYVVSPESATALAIYFRDMKAHGLDETFFGGLSQVADPYPRIAAALVGRSVRMTLSQREWQGTTRNNVDRVQPLAGGGLVPGGIPVPGQVGGVPPVPQPGAPAAPQPQPTPQPAATPAPQPAPAPVAPQPTPQPPAQPAPVQQPAPIQQQPPIDVGDNQPTQSPAPQPKVPTQPAPPPLPF